MVDPETGQVIVDPAAGGVVDTGTGEVLPADPMSGVVSGGAPYVAGVPVTTQASSGWGPYTGLLLACLVVVVALLFAPPLVARRLARGSAEKGGDGA